MSIPISCYDNIIGLCSTACECFDTDEYEGSISQSGLYICDKEPLNRILGGKNCENTTVWQLMYLARQNAIRRFIADSNSALSSNYKLRRSIFKGGIGNASYTLSRILTTAYAGVRMYCADIKGGVLKINNIGTLFSTTGTIDVLIYNNLNELVETITVNHTQDKHTRNTVSVELPLHSNYIENLEYYFIYDTSSKTPKNNDLLCNCGNRVPVFNTQQPYFNKLQHERYRWSQYVNVGSFTTDTLDFYSLVATGTNYMNGLTFDVELYCRPGDVFCTSGEDMDFTSDPKAAALAHSILYASCENVLRYIIASPDLNRLTMVGGETMEKFMVDYGNKYKEMFDYVIADVDLTKTDCFDCRNRIDIWNKPILS